MSDFPDGSGLIATIAGGIASIGAGFLLLRKYLSSDSVERAGNEGLLQIIELLRAQVDREQARADAAVKARDDAIDQITQLRQQVAELTTQVQNLRKQVGDTGVTST
jgi:hypothetical protein